jgi:hypothetical protein
LYNDKYLYISARMLNSRPAKPYVASSMTRDFPFSANDAFGVIIDSFGDHTNGYGFYVSVLGVQREEQIYSGSTVDATWDIKWESAVQKDTGGWTVEMAIPFRYLRYDVHLPSWNVNFLRNAAASGELSSWVPTPRNFTFPNLAYAGKLTWQQPPKTTSHNISLVPSVTLNTSQNLQSPLNTTLKPSLDTKITLTSSLNLDLTINPDFSQAEADVAQVNLTRFPISYPETRLFFIENSDLFSEFGINKGGTSIIHPFYSRSIGLKYNEVTGQYEQTSIIAGARLSGKITKDLRIGIMTVQTAAAGADSAVNSRGYPSENYTVIALQQKIFSSSNVGMIFTNREAFGTDSTKNTSDKVGDYNRLLGFEYNLASTNNQWTGKLFEEILFEPDKTSSSQGALLNYNTPRTISYWGITRATNDFNPDMGFVPRNNFFNPYSEISYVLYPLSGAINFFRPVIHYSLFTDLNYHPTDGEYKAGTEVAFKNTADMYVLLVNDYTKLFQPFNPALNNGKSLPAGSQYHYWSASFYYLSDLRKQVQLEFYTQTGQYYNGHYAQFDGYLYNKAQPWGTFGVNYYINLIRLPSPYSGSNIYAIGPVANLSFSRSFFFNSNIQYTSTNNNINYYFRLQWRYRPLSDLYLVYTNNQSTQPWIRQNQSLTLKLIYFL